MSVTCGYWNCASGLVRKTSFIHYLISSRNLDALFIAEAEVCENIDMSFLIPVGFELFLSPTLKSRKKSRLICLARSGIFRLIVSGRDARNDLLVLEQKNSYFIGVYRGFKCFDGETERSNFVRILNDLDHLDYNKDITIVGDLNIDVESSSRFKNELLEWTDKHGLSIAETDYTRRRVVAHVTQESRLDLLITNRDNFKVDISFNDFSDHALLTFNKVSSMSVFSKKQKVFYSNWRIDEEEAMTFLRGSLSRLPVVANVHDLDYGIRASLILTIRKFVITREMSVRGPSQVVSPLIVKLRNRKSRLLKTWNKKRSPESWSLFLSASKALRSEVRRVRAQVLRGRMKKGSKEFWSEVGKLMGKTMPNGITLNAGGKEISDDKVIAETFSNFFQKKVDGILGAYSPFPHQGLHDGVIDFEQLTCQELELAFNRLTNKKCSGMDGIPCSFLKSMSKVLIPYLVKLFNMIIKENAIPDTWKISRICPVFKKGSSLQVENYRPVSNLNSVAKLFEICLLQRFERFDSDFMMGVSQHGFRSHRSTVSATASLISHVSDLVENKKQVAIYSVDLTAAFDVLRKETLVDLLIKKGIPMYLIRTIHGYLTDRMGYVQVNEMRSCVRDIKAGCIQGSILGPYLFCVYMSELESVLENCQLFSYADDTYVVVEGENVDEVKMKVQTTMESHLAYLKKIGMVCNAAKTELMVVNQTQIKIKIGSIEISSNDSMKVLGLILDNDLGWKSYVNKLVNKTRSLTFALRFVRQHLSVKEMIPIVNAHVIGRLTYGSPIWQHSLNFRQRASLRSAYFRVLRQLVRDFNFRMSRSDLLRASGVESLDKILMKRASVFLFNIVYNLEPTDLASKLMTKAYYNDRAMGKLKFFDSSTSRFGKKCITNFAAKLVECWKFDWFFLTPLSFKQRLRESI